MPEWVRNKKREIDNMEIPEVKPYYEQHFHMIVAQNERKRVEKLKNASESEIEKMFIEENCKKIDIEINSIKDKIEAIQKYRDGLKNNNFNCPLRFVHCKIDNFVKGKNNKIVDYINTITIDWNDSLFLYGEPGTGKTHLAYGLFKKWRWSRPESFEWKAVFISAPRLFLILKDNFKKDTSQEEVINNFIGKSLLVIDDIGSEKITDFVLESWYTIIDYRYANMLPTLYTSNISIENIACRMGDRIASRLSAGKVFKLKGEDYRLKNS